MEKKLVRQASTMSHWVPPNRVAAERDREPGGKRGFWERLQKGARRARALQGDSASGSARRPEHEQEWLSPRENRWPSKGDRPGGEKGFQRERRMSPGKRTGRS